MFKTLLSFIFFSLFTLCTGFTQGEDLIQLRVYHFDNEEEFEVTSAFMEKDYLPELRKRGFKQIGVFRNHAEEGDTTKSLYLLLAVNDIDDLHIIDNDLLLSFPTEKHYARVENIFLKAFKDMPHLQPSKLQGPRADRVYELRSYESINDQKFRNKVDMFNAGGEVILFEKLGFNAVFYGEVVAGRKMPNLMYMTTHDSEEAMKANWKSFVDAPEWKAMKSMPKYQNNVSHIDKYFLYPLDYSDY